MGVDSYGQIISGIQLIPHASRKEYRTMHALYSWCIVSYLTMWLCGFLHWWNLMNDVIMWIVWKCVHGRCYFLWCLYTCWL